jgi:hypothetical protein
MKLDRQALRERSPHAAAIILATIAYCELVTSRRLALRERVPGGFFIEAAKLALRKVATAQPRGGLQ